MIGLVRGELEYAMPASVSTLLPHRIAVLMSAAGRFLVCKNCQLSFEFPAGTAYLTIAKQFDSHTCGSPIRLKDNEP